MLPCRMQVHAKTDKKPPPQDPWDLSAFAAPAKHLSDAVPLLVYCFCTQSGENPTALFIRTPLFEEIFMDPYAKTEMLKPISFLGCVKTYKERDLKCERRFILVMSKPHPASNLPV